MNQTRYNELLKRGNQILEKLMPEINNASDQFIRNKDTFRRQEDCNEIAIALALYDEVTLYETIDGLLT